MTTQPRKAAAAAQFQDAKTNTSPADKVGEKAQDDKMTTGVAEKSAESTAKAPAGGAEKPAVTDPFAAPIETEAATEAVQWHDVPPSVVGVAKKAMDEGRQFIVTEGRFDEAQTKALTSHLRNAKAHVGAARMRVVKGKNKDGKLGLIVTAVKPGEADTDGSDEE